MSVPPRALPPTRVILPAGLVNHAYVRVPFEFEKVIGRIDQKEGKMFFGSALESNQRFLEKGKIFVAGIPQSIIKFFPVYKGDPKVPGIHCGRRIYAFGM